VAISTVIHSYIWMANRLYETPILNLITVSSRLATNYEDHCLQFPSSSFLLGPHTSILISTQTPLSAVYIVLLVCSTEWSCRQIPVLRGTYCLHLQRLVFWVDTPYLKLSAIKMESVCPSKTLVCTYLQIHVGSQPRRSSTDIFTDVKAKGEWSASRPDRTLAPGKELPAPTVQEAGWTPEPV
jgi:hypothetical protein